MRGLGAGLAIGLISVSYLPQGTAGDGAVGCVRPGDLYAYLDARERHDDRAADRMLHAACRSIQGRHYEVVSDRNGLVLLRVAPPGREESVVELYAIDEMLESP